MENENEKFITDVLQRRTQAYEKFTQELFRHLSPVIEGIKEFLMNFGVQMDTVEFKDMETVETLIVFVLTGTRNINTPVGVVTTENMFSIQIPKEIVFNNDQQGIVAFLKKTHVESVDELYKTVVTENGEHPVPEILPGQKRTLH